MKKIIISILCLFASFAYAQVTPLDIDSNGIKNEPIKNTATEQKADISYKDAFVLGIVEGVTEFLPVSSTGHLILANSFLNLDSEEPLTDANGLPILNEDNQPYTLKSAADAYAIVIQIGAIAAVAILYWKYILMIFAGLIGRNPLGLRLFINLVVAFLPAAIIGMLLHKAIEEYLFGIMPVIIALAVGAFLMFAVQKFYANREARRASFIKMEDLKIRHSLMIGFLQCVAMFPGTSRSMMTILGGYLAKMRPEDSAKFSFLLGLITLSAASVFKMYKDGDAIMQSISVSPLLLGLAVAFISSALSVKWLVGFLNRKGLAPFAWYRLAIAMILALLLYYNFI